MLALSINNITANVCQKLELCMKDKKRLLFIQEVDNYAILANYFLIYINYISFIVC